MSESHAAHAGIGKYVGLTMAALGVLLALCSAFVGSERTELVKSMVEQSNVGNEYAAQSTKYRLMVAQLEQTYAVTPSRKATDEAAAKLAAIAVPPAGADIAALGRSTFNETAALLTPRTSEIRSFLTTIERYDRERAAARAWAESFDDRVHAHFEASEQYERAQLIAEIGIVVASIALLLGSRPIWFASLAALVASLAFGGVTYAHAHAAETHAEAAIEHAKAHYEELRGAKDAAGARESERLDAELLKKIRDRYAVDEPAQAPTAPGEH